MAQALRIDSIPLTMPDNKCPANISRIEFVMATPGTNGIMAPMIMLSRLCPHPSLTPIHAVNPTAKAPKSSLIKRIFVIVLTLISTQKPIAPTTAAKGISNQSYFAQTESLASHSPRQHSESAMILEKTGYSDPTASKPHANHPNQFLLPQTSATID